MPSLVNLRVCPLGLLLVAESNSHLAHLQLEAAVQLIKDAGGKGQLAINASTDIVIVGNTAREKDFETSARGCDFAKQRDIFASGRREKPLREMTLEQFAVEFDLVNEVIQTAVVADFGGPTLPNGKVNKKYILPGDGRTRASLLPRTLVLTNGPKGAAKGLVPLFFVDDNLFPA